MNDQVVKTELGGRASTMFSSRVIQLFGSAFGSSLPNSAVAEIELHEGWAQQNKGVCEKLWRVRTSGICLQRYTEDGLGPIAPNDFNTSQIPAGASRGGSGYFKVRISASTSSVNSVYDIDVGETLDLYAYKIDLSLIGPAGTVEVTPGNRAGLSATGILVDARIGAAILQIEESVANRDAKLTQHLSVTAGTQATIAVPNGAVGVNIIQAPFGSNSGDWIRHVGDPATVVTTFQTGRISFLSGGSILEHYPLGDETFLQTDQDNQNDRYFTVIWTIRP